ncbi:LSU ribosomal protein L21P [Nitrosospira sp. Nsp14]|nr:LSU ribosomal protein L21P [Nitrosospira sp. Nsp14]
MYNCCLPFSGTVYVPWSLTQEKELAMYAIIKTGGKQYRVENGLKLKIEQIPADVGSEVVIDQVLLISDGDNISMGTPVLNGASVTATVLKQGRHDKIRIFKMRRRKHYQKHQGHRQNYTEIQISGISA